ncbi:MAG: cation transporter [Bacteroidia bacterium]|jgi:divalent metal cation (Fe/Co/Zn/Cd) transporter|nr:cation transporter [Bacteroidia bacterium]
MINEKRRFAFYSALSLIFLTGSELIAGIATESLGILSLAIYSGLNLIAAIFTFYLVRISNRPCDKKHNFGHGKIENLSVFIKTTLLFIICFWIIFEALYFLITPNTDLKFTYPLFKRSVEALLDFPSRERVLIIEKALNSSHEIVTYHSLKVKIAGADTFVSVVVNLNPQLKLDQSHEICNNVEREICKMVDRCDVFVHVEPLNQKNQIL